MANPIRVIQKQVNELPAAAGAGFGKLVADRLGRVEELADLMAGAITDGLRAESRMFNIGTKELERFPDNKTRLHAFEVAMEHMEGKPVERQIVKHINEPGQVDEAAVLSKLAQSPALREAMRAAIEEAEGSSAPVVQLPASKDNDAAAGEF